MCRSNLMNLYMGGMKQSAAMKCGNAFNHPWVHFRDKQKSLNGYSFVCSHPISTGLISDKAACAIVQVSQVKCVPYIAQIM